MAPLHRKEEKRVMNPIKRIKMLKRRLQAQQEIISSLEQQNYNLVTELNDTKLSLRSTSDDYNKLVSKNYNQAVRLNHSHEEFLKMKNTLDSGILTALKSVGNMSEVLLNLKNCLARDFSDLKTENPVASSSSSSCSNTVQAIPIDSKRNQAAVSPMVSGYVIGHPTISLQRLRLAPDEVSVELREENSPRLEPVNKTRCGLSPIQEEKPPNEAVRTRLGSRTVPQQHTGTAPRVSDFIPEAHSEPVVRLSDVSRLLSNTSWLSLNFSPRNENSAENGSGSGSISPSPSPSRGPVSLSTSSITVRSRKKARKVSNLANGSDSHINVESIPNITVNIQPSTSVHMEVNENISTDHCKEERSSNVTDNEEEPPSSTNVIAVSPIAPDRSGNVTMANSSNMSIVESTLVNISSGMAKSGAMTIPTVLHDQLPSTSQIISGERSTAPRKSKRKKKPSLRYLEGEDSFIRNPKKSIIRRSSGVPQRGRKKKESETIQCEDTSSLEEGNGRRTSGRSKKVIKYLDEPISETEMKKIMKKGLKKRDKK